MDLLQFYGISNCNTMEFSLATFCTFILQQTEEVVLEIYDNDLIDSTKVKKAIESGINKKFNKKYPGGSKR